MNNSNHFSNKPVRSTLLTVLCILTFIGSGYGILTSTYSFVTAPKTVTKAQEKFKESQQKMETDLKDNKKEGAKFAQQMMKETGDLLTLDRIRKSAAISFAMSLLTLIGAILMFMLNRIGFFVYIGGTILGIALPFALFGNGLLTGIAAGFSGFVGVVFIILFALTLKEMNPAPIEDNI